MIKFRWYYDIDKDEEFLNSMSKRGYELVEFFLGFYTFKKCEPNEYTYRIDLIGNKSIEEMEEYLDVIEDSGAILIKKWGPWAFFKKKGNFELYTDTESKIRLYTRIRNMFAFLSVIELVCSLINIIPPCIYKYPYFGSLFGGILCGLIFIVFINQVFKCNKKIKDLKNNI